MADRPDITMDVFSNKAQCQCRVSVGALVNLKTTSCHNYCPRTLFQRLCAQRMTCRESLKHTVILRDTPK